ncbi:MAG: hypothetical protein JSS81_06130 [Acidobacteria bacterium]|nr:hypothetical protein [Acidobacteriota bacterium]
MTKPKFLFSVIFLLIAGAAGVFAQTDSRPPKADPCYEVVLQTIVASNAGGGRDAVPPALAGIVKKLKAGYDFSDYRLMNSFLQRTNNYIEYKSLANDFGQTADKNYPAFFEWSLKGIQNLVNAQGKNVLQFESFRFGMRVPLVNAARDESGKPLPASVSYEGIGLSTMRFSLPENEPTVVGSLATAKPGELLFLVLTVRPVE